jgi:glycosyltransferase involved in cell wall biosynthesis
VTPTVFIGITTWNSELLIGHSLAAWRRHTSVPMRLVVWDNASTDATPRLAREAGGELVIRASTQADALNGLWRLAREEYVLLAHADVVVLSDRWFELCSSALSPEGMALVSPEDVGCGPYTRPFGLGMPESSFLFARRGRMERIERTIWRRWRRLPYPRRGLDFDAPHVTHRLPLHLASAGLGWARMQVQPSDSLPGTRFGPYPGATVWTEELAHLRYGLGNFYHLHGIVTHYHNWYDRIPRQGDADSRRATTREFPRAFIRDYTAAFLADYTAGHLIVTPATDRDREPTAL